MRPRTLVLVLTALAAMLVLAPSAFAKGGKPLQQFTDRGPSNLDTRASARAADADLSPVQGEAVARLQASIGSGAIVDVDPITTTPRIVANRDGFLTGPSSQAAQSVAMGYVLKNLDAFGLTAKSLTEFRFVKDYVDIGGTHHVTWIQTIGGIDAFDSFLRAAVTKDGRLVNVTGSPLRTAGVRSLTPQVSAESALGTALRDGRGTGLPLSVLARGSDAMRSTKFVGGHSAKLTLFAVPGGAKLGWLVNAKANSQGEYYDVVDAESGALLYRSNMVSYATGMAWDYYPSALLGSGVGTQTSRTFTPWLTSSTKLEGNYAHVYKDVNDDNTPVLGDEVAAVSGNWNYPFTQFNNGNFLYPCDSNFQCSWNPDVANSWSTNDEQNATQVFYYVNKFHDHLAAAPIGFTPAAGNFEGVDKVQAQVNDGANTGGGFPDNDHMNNANMGTGADGSPPRMQMYLFSGFGPGPDANGGDDASVIYHEYTHGLSHRLVALANGIPALNGFQASSMGEAWSDWYAMDYLVKNNFDADSLAIIGDVNVGYFMAGGDVHTLRTESMDCPVSPGSDPSTDGTSCNGGSTIHYGGYTYADIGQTGGAPEVHSDGEVWGQTIWQIRQQLGYSVTEALLSRGMELSTTNPSMLDMRDAIIQADVVNYSGSHKTALWNVFANRGMGVWATTNGTDDTNPVANTTAPTSSGGGTLTGTVTNAIGGAPISGVMVTLGGMSAQTNASGAYTITNIPPHSYAVRAYKGGYSMGTATKSVVAGSNSQNFSIKRNWASMNAGGTITSFTAPDYKDLGCGPFSAIDDFLQSGWGSDAGTRQITVKLPQVVNVQTTGGIAIDPKNTCGDPAASALASYKVETSPNGTAFTQVATGAFNSGNNGHLNPINISGTGTNVQYVRLTMMSSQGGGLYMDMSELQVYGSSASTPAPSISGFTPSSGKTRTLVTINGANLGGATAVKLGPTAASSLPMPIMSNSPTQITAYVWDYNTYYPTGKIWVTTPGGTVGSATNFTITLGISSVAPQSGPANANVTIGGVGFNSGSTVKFNTVSATVVSRTPTQIVAKVPNSASATGKITVTNTTGVTGTVTSWWTFTKT